MPVRLEDVRARAEQALESADAWEALHLFTRIVQSAPHDCESRIRIADALQRLGHRAEAQRAYMGAGVLAARGGRPLPAIVAAAMLKSLQADGAALLELVAGLYAGDSPQLGVRGARLSAPVGVSIDERALDKRDPDARLVSRAVEVACAHGDLRLPDQLQAIPLLSRLPRMGLLRLLELIKVHRIPTNTLIVREGDEGHSLFFCATGHLTVFRQSEAGIQELGGLGEGGIFGEMALLGGGLRTASVRTETASDVLEIGSEVLEAVARAMPSAAEALERYRRERLLRNLLTVSPLFRPFSPEQRMELLEHFEIVQAKEGEVLIQQGQEGRGLFVILDGECEVSRAADRELDVEVARLRVADVFGEISLLHQVPATATVCATKPTTLLVLPGMSFQRLASGVEEVGQYFEQLSANRLRRTGNLMNDEVLLQVADGLLE